MNRAREIARRALSHRPLVVLLAVAGVLLGAELVARALVPPPRASFLAHPFLGYVHPPGFKMTKVSFSGSEFVYETNALGLRGSVATLAKPAGTYRIIFVGGSTTENGDLPEAETFPGLVEAALNAALKGSPRVEVANAGVPGGFSATSLAQVSQRLLELKPDLICELDAMNDLGDSLRDDWDPALMHLATPQRPKLKDWLLETSRLVAAFDSIAKKDFERDARQMFAKRVQARNKRPVREPTFDLGRGVERFQESQRRLVTLCRAEGVAAVLLTQPTLLKPDLSPDEDARLWNTLIPGTDWNLKPATLLAALESYNAAIRKTAAAEQAILVDASAAVPRDLAHFMDDVHLTLTGNASVADVVVRELLRTGTLPKSSR